MAQSLKRVVVAGGTGLVGRALVAALAGGGVQVTVLSRAPGKAVLPAGAQARGWDDLPESIRDRREPVAEEHRFLDQVRDQEDRRQAGLALAP